MKVRVGHRVKTILGIVACLGVVLGGLGMVGFAWSAEPTTAPADASRRVAALIVQLGDDSAAKREQASEELAQIGMEAMGALQQAAKDPDPEIAARARSLLISIPRGARVVEACLRWKAQLPDGLNRGLVLSKDCACIYGGDANLHVFALSDGKQAWEHAIGNPDKMRLGVVDNTLVFLPYSSDKIAPTGFDLTTGKMIWEGKDRGLASCVTNANQVVYVNEGSKITSLKADGTFLWQVKLAELGTGDFVIPTPLGITENAVLLALASEGGKTANQTLLLALDPATGEKRWETRYTTEQLRSHGFDGQRIFLAMKNDMKVYDLKSGKVQDTKLGNNVGNLDNPMCVVGNHLLCGLVDRLTANDIDTGRQLWTYEAHQCGVYGPNALNIHGIKDCGGAGIPAVVMHEGLVLCGVGSELVALDIETGKPVWQYPVSGVIVCVPIVRDAVAYFITGEGTPSKVTRMQPDPDKADETEEKPFGSSKNYLYALDLTKARQLGLPDDDAGTR